VRYRFQGHSVEGRPVASRARRVAGLALASCLLVAAAAEGTAQSPPATPEVLRAGDLVRVQVWRQPELSGEFSVTEQGVVAHPLYREVTVAGRPLPEVTEALRLFLGRFETDPNLIVEPLFRVSVGGEVRQPNVHLLRPGTTVSEAVASSGGFTERAAARGVILRRGNADYRIDLTDPASSLPGTTVRSGDQIFVERERSIFREYVLPVITVAGSVASIYRVFSR
jgi:protein involved in polysaccharide export with SLBB domain